MKTGNIFINVNLLFSFALLFIIQHTNAGIHKPDWASIFYDGSSNPITANTIKSTTDGGYVFAGGYGYGITKVNINGAVEWHQVYSRDPFDQAQCIEQTRDGGYIVSGTSSLLLYDRIWILKLDSEGNSEWQKVVNFENESFKSRAYSIKETLTQNGSPDGYLIAGSTIHLTGASWDVWVLKTDLTGLITWQKTYNIHTDRAYSADQTFDQDGVPTGYLVAGSTGYFGGNAWLLKLNLDGSVDWEKIYGGSSQNANSIQQTRDGGFIVAGQGVADDLNLYPGKHFWIAKLNSDGTIQWQKIYGGADGEDVAFSVEEVVDVSGTPNGYVVAGETSNFDAGQKDIWVLKIDSNGTIEWEKTYGGSLDESANSIQQSFDPEGNPDGYVVAGYTWSYTTNRVAFVLKLDRSGEIPECDLMDNSDATISNGTWYFYAPPYDVFVTDSNSGLSATDVSPSSPDGQTELICYSEPVPVAGDINWDGEIDLADVITAMQILAGLSPEEAYRAADMDDNGKIGMEEVLIILRQQSF